MKVIFLDVDSERIKVALIGELNSLTAKQFALDFEPVMEHANKEITLDFSQLAFISSAGMRTMLQLNKLTHAQGGKIIIIGMSEEIKQIFGLTGFDKMFEIR